MKIVTGSELRGGKVYRRLLKSVKPYLWVLIGGLLATVLVSATDSGLTYMIKPIVNETFVNKNQSFVVLIPWILFGALAFRVLCNFASRYLIQRTARTVVMDMRKQVFYQLMYLPKSYYDQHSSGYLLAALVYNVDQVADASTDALIRLFREGMQGVGMMIVMFVVSWQLAVLLIVISPVLAYVIRLASKRLRRLSHSVQETVGDVTHAAEEGIEGFQVIRMNNTQEHEYKKFSQVARDNRHRELKIVVTNSLSSGVVQLIMVIPAVIIFWVIGHHFIHISAGGFAAILTALVGLLRPVREMTKINATIQKGIAGAASIFALLDMPREEETGKATIEADIKGKVQFNDVYFSYAGADKPALEGITFDVEPGQTVALVGHSGSGKTTILNLIPRLYDAEQGSVSIDGVDITDYQRAALRSQIAYVSQRSVLFNTTIEDNMAYGCIDYTQEQLRAAAKAAHALEFIESLPDGFATQVGENGAQLSGGQVQRIAIARAIMKDAPILLLDEATSALDSQSEQVIQAAIDELIKDRTTIVVAHRLSTIERADKIMVMQEGRIVENGTHQALLEAKGAYYQLYTTQHSIS